MADLKPTADDQLAVSAAKLIIDHVACKVPCGCSGACYPDLQRELRRLIKRSGRRGFLEEFDGPPHGPLRIKS